MAAEKHRILCIGTLPPPIHGSAVVSQQIKDSIIINESFDCDWINLGTSRTMDEIGKNNPVKIFRLFFALLKEFWYLLTKQYNLCYLAITCHGSGFLKDSPFVLMCKLFRKKIIIHQHNKGMANDLERWPYRWLLPLCYSNSKVILLSWYLYPDIEKLVKKDDVYICPNGISIQELKNLRVQSNNNNNKTPKLLFLSNLIKSKGVLVLLDALKILKEQGVTFICDFVGGESKDIDSKRFLEEVEERGLNDMAFYHGKKFGDEKDSFFNQADLFVFPTQNDCFPLVLLEAMSFHLPIVTTDIGGIPDIVEDGMTGVIIKKQQKDCIEEKLAAIIKTLIENPVLREQMGENGWQRLNNLYTTGIFERQLLSILNSVV